MRYIPDTKEELKILCDDLTINLGNIDTSKITDMSGLFKNSKRTKEQFSGIESWDVSNVEDMHNMFEHCRHIVWHDLGQWNVSKVKDFSSMFAYVTGEAIDTQNGIDYYPPDGVWNCNVKNWDVSGGLKFKNMFYSSNFQEKIPNWNMKVDDPEFDIQTKEDFFTIFDNSLYDTNSADDENWQTDYPQVLTKKLGLFYSDRPVIDIRFNENIDNTELSELEWLRAGVFPQDVLDRASSNIADYLRNAFTLEIYVDQELKSWIEVNMSGNEETGQISLWPVACHLGDIDNYTECGEEISLDLFKSPDYKKAIEAKLYEIALNFYGDELNTIPGLKEKLSKSFKDYSSTKEELNSELKENVIYSDDEIRGLIERSADYELADFYGWYVNSFIKEKKDMILLSGDAVLYEDRDQIKDFDEDKIYLHSINSNEFTEATSDQIKDFCLNHLSDFRDCLNTAQYNGVFALLAQRADNGQFLSELEFCALENFDYDVYKECLDYQFNKYKPHTRNELVHLINHHKIALEKIDTSLITDMSYLFADANGLKAANRLDNGISKWNVSNVKNMEGMFINCKADISGIKDWTPSSVENVRDMFSGCQNSKIDLSSWAKYRDFNQVNIKGFCDFSNVKIPQNWKLSTENYMYAQHYAMMGNSKDGFWLDPKEYGSPDNAETMAKIVSGYENVYLGHKTDEILFFPQDNDDLKALCDISSVNLGQINTEHITDMSELFKDSSREDYSGIDKWNTSKVTNINSMFSNSKFNADISNWDVSNVQYMFEFLDDVDYKYDLSCWLNPANPNGLKLENIYPAAVEYNNENYIEGNSYVNPTGDFSDIFIYYSTPGDALFTYENIKHPEMAKVLIKSQNVFKTVDWKAIDDETRDWIIQCCNKSVLQDLLKDDSISNLQKLDVSMMDDFSNLCECCPERTDFSGIEKWHMSNAKDVSFMFTGTKFNQDVSLWRLSDGCNTTGLFNGCNISNENLHKAANAWGLDPRKSELLVTDADLVPKDYNLNPRIIDLGTGREVKQDISWNNHRDDAFRALDEKLERISRDLEETKAEIKKYRGR